MSEPCVAITSKRWHGGGTPCRIPAWQDGYCRQHHPAVRAKTLSGDIERAVKAQAAAMDRVDYYTKEVARLKAEKKRWDDFIAQKNE